MTPSPDVVALLVAVAALFLASLAYAKADRAERTLAGRQGPPASDTPPPPAPPPGGPETPAVELPPPPGLPRLAEAWHEPLRDGRGNTIVGLAPAPPRVWTDPASVPLPPAHLRGRAVLIVRDDEGAEFVLRPTKDGTWSDPHGLRTWRPQDGCGDRWLSDDGARAERVGS